MLVPVYRGSTEPFCPCTITAPRVTALVYIFTICCCDVPCRERHHLVCYTIYVVLLVILSLSYRYTNLQTKHVSYRNLAGSCLPDSVSFVFKTSVRDKPSIYHSIGWINWWLLCLLAIHNKSIQYIDQKTIHTSVASMPDLHHVF